MTDPFIHFFAGNDIPAAGSRMTLLLYCLRGALTVRMQDHAVSMVIRDLLVLNVGDSYEITADPDTLAMAVGIGAHTLETLLGRRSVRIRLDSAAHSSTDYGQIRFLLDSIAKHSMHGNEAFKVRSLYYLLWDSVCEGFLPDETAHTEEAGSGDGDAGNTCDTGRQTARILEDIAAHYGQPLSLASMAGKYYMSESVFSRFFYRQTGAHFSEYLRRVRMEHAEDLLVSTDRPVTEIAYDCGFASLSVFNRNFRQSFGKTPGQLRAAYRKEAESRSAADAAALKELADTFPDSDSESRYTSRYIHVEAGGGKACGICTDILDIGMAEDLLDAAVRRQLEEHAAALGVRYVRIGNLFAPALNIRRGHDTGHLNFEKTDLVLDLIVHLGLLPLLEFSEKIRKMVVRADATFGRYTAGDGKIPDPVFLDLAEWTCVLEKFLRHLISRYSLQAVSRWKYEIWYDGEQATGAGKIPFPDLYRETFLLIRRLIPDAGILASGLTVGVGEEALAGQLRFYKASGLLPDGLSLLIYPYKIREHTGQDTRQQIVSDAPFVAEELQAFHQLLLREHYPEPRCGSPSGIPPCRSAMPTMTAPQRAATC